MRRQKLGTALLKELEKELKKRSINYIASWVREENTAMRGFFGKYGFKKGYPFVWMEKTDKPLWPEHKKDLSRFKREKDRK